MRFKPRVRAAFKTGQPVATPNCWRTETSRHARLRLPRAYRSTQKQDVVALALEAEEGGHAAQQPPAKEVLMEPPAETAQAHEHREPDGRSSIPGEGRAAR